MKIEEEILQPKFRNEFQKATINLIYTANWLTNKHKDFFQQFEITLQQYNVLRILRGQHPHSISTSEIKRRMLDKNSDASRIVDRLEQKVLVLKKTCDQDKRLVDVNISEKGLGLLQEIDQEIDRLDNGLGNLSQQEAQKLSELLDKIRE